MVRRNMTRLLLNYEKSAIVYEAIHENGLKNGMLAPFGFGGSIALSSRNNMLPIERNSLRNAVVFEPTLALPRSEIRSEDTEFSRQQLLSVGEPRRVRNVRVSAG